MASELNKSSELQSLSATKETPPSEEEVEISRDEALTSLLKNDELSDLSLRGSDGVCVTANRCLLASRSPVFHRMLFGQFKEAFTTVIDVNYEGAVLQAVVDYIYTDKIPLMTTPETPWDINFARFLVTVMDAANYFTLPELRRKIEHTVKNEIHDTPASIAPLFLAVCSPLDCDGHTTEDLQINAMEAVYKDPDILVNGNKEVLALIQPSIIGKLLKDFDGAPDTHKLFQILHSWATAGESTSDNLSDDEDSSSRKRSAAQMTNHLRLENIDIEKLSTTVSSSGLVTEKQISDAYKTQALRAQKKLRTVHEQLRTRPGIWKSSRTTIFEYDSTISTSETETLFCSIMKGGVHRWSFRVLRYSREMELGVASTSCSMSPSGFLSRQQGGWALTDGCAMNHSAPSRVGLPRFKEGSTVSFMLDLEGDGILKASIDGGPIFELFTGKMITYEGEGFVPAISDDPYYNSRVEFLGFEDEAAQIAFP